MLTEDDLRVSFQILAVFSQLSVFPVRVNKNGDWKFEPETRKLKKYFAVFLYLIQCGHFLFNMFRLVEAMIFFVPETLPHFGCSCLCTSGEFVALLDLYLQFKKRPDLTFAIYNTTIEYMTGNGTGSRESRSNRDKLMAITMTRDVEEVEDGKNPLAKRESKAQIGVEEHPDEEKEELESPEPKKMGNLKRMLALNVQEFLAINLVPGFVSCVVLHIFLYLRSPTNFNFVYSILPENMQTPLFLWILAGFEAYVTMYWAAGINLRIFINVLFIIMCREKVEETMKNIREEEGKVLKNPALMKESLFSLRKLQLLLNLYNTNYSTINFLLKLENMLNATFLFFIAIHLIHRDWINGLMFFWIGLNAGSIFPVSYDSAFKIKDGVHELKREMRVANLKLVADPQKQAEYDRMVQSIPAVGIKIGEFRVVERTATVDFMDFVVSRICDLLLTFG